MKQKFTFTGLILLIAVFAFGQSFSEKKDRLSQDNQIEVNKETSDKDMSRIMQGGLWATNIQKTKSPSMHSVQASKQRLDSLSRYEWDKNAQQWFETSRNTKNFDSQGNMSEEIFYERSLNSSQWVITKYEYTYDANNNMTECLSLYWSKTTNQWDKRVKRSYTYNANGRMTEELYSPLDKNTNQWVEGWKYNYSFDDLGNKTEVLRSNWNDSSSRWDNMFKFAYAYDANGNATQKLNSDWDTNTNQWVESGKCTYTYDALGNKTQMLVYERKDTTEQLSENQKYVLTYDANGKMAQVLISSFDSKTTQWNEIQKVEYTLDNTYSMNDLIVPYYFSGQVDIDLNSKLVGILNYYKDEAGAWGQSHKTTYYYSEQNVTNVDDVEIGTIELYPNPVSESLNLRFTSTRNTATFELFDMQGRRLISKEISNNEQLSLGDLKNGVYLYNLSIDGNKQSGKLVKK